MFWFCFCWPQIGYVCVELSSGPIVAEALRCNSLSPCELTDVIWQKCKLNNSNWRQLHACWFNYPGDVPLCWETKGCVNPPLERNTTVTFWSAGVTKLFGHTNRNSISTGATRQTGEWCPCESPTQATQSGGLISENTVFETGQNVWIKRGWIGEWKGCQVVCLHFPCRSINSHPCTHTGQGGEWQYMFYWVGSIVA